MDPVRNGDPYKLIHKGNYTNWDNYLTVGFKKPRLLLLSQKSNNCRSGIFLKFLMVRLVGLIVWLFQECDYGH